MCAFNFLSERGGTSNYSKEAVMNAPPLEAFKVPTYDPGDAVLRWRVIGSEIILELCDVDNNGLLITPPRTTRKAGTSTTAFDIETGKLQDAPVPAIVPWSETR